MPPRPPIRLLTSIRHSRRFSTAHPRLSTTTTSIPTTPTCPPPTCPCAPSPPDLEIDRTTPLLHTIAPYAQQIVFCTGTTAWPSNIETDTGAAGAFVRGVKSVVGRGSKGFDPYTNILITAASFANTSCDTPTQLPEDPSTPAPPATTALLFPSFTRLSVPHSPPAFAALAAAYLRPATLHAAHAALPAAQTAHLRRDTAQARLLPAPVGISAPTILICGHGARDARCGALGPVLQAAFERELGRRGLRGEVAQVSHVGGHKWAGNVIVYVPPGWRGGRGGGGDEESLLAGAGIWYGRVGPEHVEGVVGETLVEGRVVVELLRGGVLRDGGDLARVVERQGKGDEEEGKKKLELKPRARG